MFDDLAMAAASTINGVFGSGKVYERPGEFSSTVTATIRKDVELLDDHEQVVGRVTTVRLAHNDITFVPERGDIVMDGATCYTLGKRLEDNGFFYVHEVTS